MFVESMWDCLPHRYIVKTINMLNLTKRFELIVALQCMLPHCFTRPTNCVEEPLHMASAETLSI